MRRLLDRAFPVAAVLLLIWGLPLPAARAQSGSDLSRGLFTASGPNGEAITDLTIEKLRVKGGDGQPVALRALGSEPLRACLVIDTSGSSSSERVQIDRAFRAVMAVFAVAVRPLKDQACEVNFSEVGHLDQPWTDDLQKITKAAKENFTARGASSINNNVAATCDYLAKDGAAYPRKVLFLITDGEDNSSSLSSRQAADICRQESVVLFALNTQQKRPRLSVFPDLVARTGGSELRFKDDDQAIAGVERMLHRLESMYEITCKGCSDSFALTAHDPATRIEISPVLPIQAAGPGTNEPTADKK